MTAHWSIWRFLVGIIIFALWSWFFCLTLERKYSRWVTLLLAIPCFLVNWSSGYIPQTMHILKTIVFSAPVFVFAMLAFHGRPGRCFLLTAVTYALTGVVEWLSLAILPDMIDLPENPNLLLQPKFAAVQILYLLMLALLLWLAALLINRNRKRLTAWQWAAYATVPVSQGLALTAFITIFRCGLQSTSWIAVGLCVAGFLAADFLTVTAIRETAKKAGLEAQNRLLAKQVGVQAEYYANLAKQYEENRRIRHDIQHHLHTIQILIRQGQNEDAERYAAELLPLHAHQTNLPQCENTVVDAFLSNRMTEAEKSGPRITAEVALPAELPVQDSDLIIVLGNLLDNAAEACADLEDAEIRLDVRVSQGCLVIREENPMAETPRKKERRIPELDRGLGLRILSDIAEKYRGSLTHTAENGRFTAVLVLNLQGSTAC